MTDKKFEEKIKNYQKTFQEVKKEMNKVVVGQEEAINTLFRALMCKGHVLFEGVPGIAKTLIIRSLATATNCQFERIQFTPDLLPSDIIGITAYEEDKGFYTMKGPVFSNFVLADEINRAPPKVQSALLEAMQEKQVTIGKNTFDLPKPFFVLATQNPIESLGTYPLPEAQIDRFLFKHFIDYPTTEEEQKILMSNMSIKKFEEFDIKSALTPQKILGLQKDVLKIYLDKKIENYIVRLVEATRNPDKYKLKLGKYVDYGASPRGSIGLFIASKSQALLNGKNFVTPQHVKEIAHDVLRHRVILNYEGQAEGIKNDDVVTEVLEKVPVP